MITFFVALALLVGGYFVYGKVIERIFQPDDRPTPCKIHPDGVDYMPINTKKAYLIQLLNIAGLGPIFGAISGALWGPVVFLWIVFGSIFAGAVHDYLSGMISIRHDGASISEIVGIYLGKNMKTVMRIFSVVLLVLVGTVFMTGPAGLLSMLTPNVLGKNFWLILIIIYYFLATMLPIDKIIGKIYPVFGLTLIIMALGIGGGIIVKGYHIPELQLMNMHPSGSPIWPLMFITVACGAISGFHATQSPLMARCLINEKDGRKVFYGAMISEGVIALIWAAAGVAFYETTGGLQAALTAAGSQAGLVYNLSTGLLGSVGGVLAIIGVVACPITSGDTAFRSARLTLSDWFKIDQKAIKKRLMLSIPLLAVGIILSQMDFQVIWRYFAWANQTLAMMALWAGAVYLCKNKLNHWVAAIPATFMSAVSCTYILMAKEGFKISTSISYPIGILFAAVCFTVYITRTVRKTPKEDPDILKTA